MAASYKLTHVLITLALLVLCFLMVLFPAETWHASVRGLSIWWDVLFPSLFPFLVLSELLLGFGIVHFLGTLLNPLMRPCFVFQEAEVLYLRSAALPAIRQEQN